MRIDSGFKVTLIVVIALILLAGLLVRRVRQNRETRCIDRMYLLQSAKEQYGLDHEGAPPAGFDDLAPIYLPAIPECPSGGRYTLGALDAWVSCSKHGSPDEL